MSPMYPHRRMNPIVVIAKHDKDAIIPIIKQY